MTRPSVERELKFAGVDLERLRERLTELEAERIRPAAFEDNLVLDRQGELQKAGCLLRVRSDGHRARLTFKGPPSFEGRTKLRLEHEAEFDDLGELTAILESIGFEVARRYQKYREEWRLGGVAVALDHTPIGDFAEFEGEGAEKLARRCGFDPGSAERRTYLRLYDDFVKEHPEAPAEMVFSDD